MKFIHHNNFAVNLWKDKIHTSNIDLRQLTEKFISHIRL